MSNTGQLVVPGQLENLARIGEFVTQAAEQAGLDARGVYAVQMAVDEACTNIIQHAYGAEEQGPIRLLYHVQAEGLQIIIYDRGGVFDPAQRPDLDTGAGLEARKSGGMGLFFVYSLMDQVEFEFDTPQGNRLTLFKRKG